MSDNVSLEFVLLRLDHIQTDIRLLRYRDEQREASHQAITATLSRQMVELSTALDDRLRTMDDRLARIEQLLT